MSGKASPMAYLVVTGAALAAPSDGLSYSVKAGSWDKSFLLNWSAGLTASWSEEIVKMLLVVLLIGLAQMVMRNVFDGLIIGAVAGLAFQVFENVAYTYGSAASNFGQAQYGTKALFLRTVLGVTGHWPLDVVCGLRRRVDLPRRPTHRATSAFLRGRAHLFRRCSSSGRGTPWRPLPVVPAWPSGCTSR